jgi:tripartite-type tricarboxylate transporter receptor subunit TctC
MKSTRLWRVAAVLLVACVGVAHAAAWPAKPVRLIVPSPAGAQNDLAARVIAEQLSKTWHQPVIVEDKPGGGTTIGTNAVAKAAPDGYTIGWVISAHAINASLLTDLPYDTVHDFAGVTLVYALKPVIVAAPAFPASSVGELIELARRNPGKLTFATPANGSSIHLLGELFKLKYGLDVEHVGYKGVTVAHPDVMQQRVSFMFDALTSVLPYVQSGKLKVIAAISDSALPDQPQYPLLKGLLPAGAAVGWNGLVVPGKTPPQLVARLNADIVAAIRSPEVQQRFASFGVETLVSTPAGFDAFIREDVTRWADVIRRAGIKAEGAKSP